MRRDRLFRGLAGTLIAAACATTAVADGVDIAACMPADTAFYVGWTPSEALNAELEQAEQIADAVMRLASDELSPTDAERIRKLLDLLLALPTHSGGLGLFDIAVSDTGPAVQAALVLHDESRSGQLLQRCEALAQSIGMPIQEGQVDHAGTALPLRWINLGGTNLGWLAYKDHVIIALDNAAAARLDNVLSCIDGNADSLADSQEFQFDRQKLGVEPTGAFFCLYADPQRIITRGKELFEQFGGPVPPIVDAALEQLGITSVRSKYLHFDADDGVPRFRAVAHTDGPPRGLLKLWDQQPLTEDDLKIIPQDAYWAEVANLNLAGLWAETRRVITELSPDMLPAVEGFMAMSTQFIGLSITDDFLPALGDTWAFFDTPDHGGILLSGTVMAVEVKDAEALDGMLAALVQRLTPMVMQVGATLRLNQTQRDGHQISYVVIGGVPSPVSPAWGFVDGRWVFGLTPQTVAVALNEIDPATRGPRLVDRADVQAARARLPKKINGFGWGDVEYFNRLFYPLSNALMTMGTSMLGGGASGFEPAELPTLPELLADSHNYVAVSSTDSDGIVYAGIGDAAPAPAMIGSAALATSVLLPSLSRARFVSKMAVSESNLRTIGQACTIYANDHQDLLPDSLDTLIAEGLLTHQVLQSPVSPASPSAYVYIPRIDSLAKVRNPSRSVLAYEVVHKERKALVLFVDGHVEKVRLERFRTLLQETYKELDREDEIPPEFRGSTGTSSH